MSARVEASASKRHRRFYPARFGLDVDSYDEETDSTGDASPQVATLGPCSQTGASGLELQSQGSGGSRLLDETCGSYSQQSAIPSPACTPCEAAATTHHRVPHSQAAALLSSTGGLSPSVPAPALPSQGFGPSTGLAAARLQPFEGASEAAARLGVSVQGPKSQRGGHALQPPGCPPGPELAQRPLKELEALLGIEHIDQGDGGAALDPNVLSEGSLLAGNTLDRYTHEGLGSLDGGHVSLGAEPGGVLGGTLAFRSQGSSQGSYDTVIHHRLLQERPWEGGSRIDAFTDVGAVLHPLCQAGLPSSTPWDSSSLGDVSHEIMTSAQGFKADLPRQHWKPEDGLLFPDSKPAGPRAEASFPQAPAEQDHAFLLDPSLEEMGGSDASVDAGGLAVRTPATDEDIAAAASLARDLTPREESATPPALSNQPLATHSGALPLSHGAKAGALPGQAPGAPALSTSASPVRWPRNASGSSSSAASVRPFGSLGAGGYEAGSGAGGYLRQASFSEEVTDCSRNGSQGEAPQAAPGTGPGTGAGAGAAVVCAEEDKGAAAGDRRGQKGTTALQAALQSSAVQLQQLVAAHHLYLSRPAPSQEQWEAPAHVLGLLDSALSGSRLSGQGRALGGERAHLSSPVQASGSGASTAGAVKQELVSGRRAVHLHRMLLQSAQQQSNLHHHQQQQQQQQQRSDHGPVDLLNPLPWILGSQQRRTGCIPAASRGKIGSSYITLSDALWKKGLTLGLERFLIPDGSSWVLPVHRPLGLPEPCDSDDRGGVTARPGDSPGAPQNSVQAGWVQEAEGELSAHSGSPHSGASGTAPRGWQQRVGGVSHSETAPGTQRASPVLRPETSGAHEEAAAAAAAPESGGQSLSQRLKSTLQTLQQNSAKQGQGSTAHGHSARGGRGVPVDQFLGLGSEMPPVFQGQDSPSTSSGLPRRNSLGRQEPLKVEAADQAGATAAVEGHAKSQVPGSGAPQAAPGERLGWGSPGLPIPGKVQGSPGGGSEKDSPCPSGGSPTAGGGAAASHQSGSIGRSPLQRGAGWGAGGVAGVGGWGGAGHGSGAGAGGTGAREEMGVRTSVLRKRLLRLVEVLDEGKSAPFLDLFKQLNPCAKAKGTAQERVLHYVLRALMHRFTGRGYDAFREPLKINFTELRETRIWYYTAFPTCPFVGITTAGTIIPRLVGHQYVHIIDLGQTMIPQWPAVIRLLACQPRCLSGAPLHFRFTYVDTTYLVAPGRNELKAVRAGPEVGRMLQKVAEAAGVSFSFELVDLDDDSWHLLYRVKRDPAAAVVVCCPLELMFHFSDSADNCHSRFQLFTWMRSLKPTVVPVVEIELDANRESLRSRVRNCFDFHTALFEAHDSTFQEEDRKKGRVFETCWHGRTICSMVACEGMQRIVRPVSLASLASHMESMGFRGLPISSKVVDVAQEMLESYPPNFGLLLNERGALQLCWEGVPLVSASMWTAEED